MRSSEFPNSTRTTHCEPAGGPATFAGILPKVNEVHVGISSGEVVVSGLEVRGAPVEAALSLAAEAAGNEIRLDDETRELAGGAAHDDPAGQGWRLIGVRPATRP